MDFLKDQKHFTFSLFFSSEGAELGGEAKGGRAGGREVAVGSGCDSCHVCARAGASLAALTA